jgi:hypothetical protein
VAVTWVTADDVVVALGQPPATANDAAYLARVTAAANEFAFERRAAGGWVDDPVVVPSARVAEGVVFLAVSCYRGRGSAEGYASFDSLGNVTVSPSGAGMVNKFLAIPKPTVA